MRMGKSLIRLTAKNFAKMFAVVFLALRLPNGGGAVFERREDAGLVSPCVAKLIYIAKIPLSNFGRGYDFPSTGFWRVWLGFLISSFLNVANLAPRRRKSRKMTPFAF